MSHLEVVKVIVADVYADAEVEASISKMWMYSCAL